MEKSVYEIVSLFLRYWFLFLAAVIVLRSYIWLFRDRREKHRHLKQLPDAGTVGQMVVIHGSSLIPEGCLFPVAWEGSLGSSRSADIFLPNEEKAAKTVAKRHMDFSFVNGKGLFVFPERNCFCSVDGVQVKFRNRGKTVMHHGSVLRVAKNENDDEYVELRLLLFQGLSTSSSPVLQPVAMETLPESESLPPVPYPEEYGEQPYPAEDFPDFPQDGYYGENPVYMPDNTGFPQYEQPAYPVYDEEQYISQEPQTHLSRRERRRSHGKAQNQGGEES